MSRKLGKPSACLKGRIDPSPTTKLRLFADSGGYCQNPSCWLELFRDLDDSSIHIAEMAHVISACDKGPRAKPSLSPEERAHYDNLILLCPICHTIIDKSESSYPEDLIKKWKKSHKEQISSKFGCVAYENRQLARQGIDQLLAENHTVFESYGPMTDERFNPGSSRNLVRRLSSEW